jgi:hypothetical protein
MAKLKADHRIVMHNYMKIDTILRTNDKDKMCSADVPEIVSLFTSLKKETNFSKGYEHDRVTLKLTEVKITEDGKYCCVMINVSDKTAGTSVMVEDTTNTHEDIALAPGKSWGVSMHVLFELTKKFGTYHVIYEQIPDVNHGRLVSFVNHMFFNVVKKNETTFTKDVRNNEIDPSTQKVKKEKFKLIFTIDPMPYDGFAKSLDAGKISDIQVVKLVEPSTNHIVDGHTEIIERSHIIKLQTPKITSGKFDYIKSVGEKYSDDYSRLRFSFTSEKNVTGTIEMNTNDLRLENLVKAFSKKSKLSDFSASLKDCYQGIHTPIMEKLIEVSV